jgi:hypothetical protein
LLLGNRASDVQHADLSLQAEPPGNPRQIWFQLHRGSEGDVTEHLGAVSERANADGSRALR